MSKIPPACLQIYFCASFLFLLTLCPHAASQPHDQEQTILLKLKQHWQSPPSINHWIPSNNASHCSWREITCTNGSVVGISLPDKNITGTIPPFICHLNYLTTIDLNSNYIAGNFPKILYNCSNLEYLDLSMNNFVGTIPDDVDRMARLNCLNLGANNFSGDIPKSIGRFPFLQVLSLVQNEFNGSFPPEIGNLSNLEVLQLAYNRFVPLAIPENFTGLKKLKMLWMTKSNLIGEIPETMGDIPALEQLDLSTNNLGGKIPSGLFRLKNLTEIYLYENRLSGEIPAVIEALNLADIDLSNNSLTGTIPDDFGKLTKLTGLALHFNQLSGQIPESIGRIPTLKSVRLFSNSLSGELPQDFGRYSMLEGFQVANNKLTGRLPEHLCAGGKLFGVVAFDNNLTGGLPKSLANCSSLLVVMLYNNGFSGNIPSGLWSSSNLLSLMISDNSFIGELPNKLGWNLSLLEISNNKFFGEIPAGISSWTKLAVFKASNNLFTGPIPKELTALPFLHNLFLDGNLLSGQLPPDIISWKSLTALNLSRNQLSGQIPEKIGLLPGLIDLDLSENQLSGEIPPQIGHLRLTSLNLSSNLLTGKIPSEFENPAYGSSFLNNSGLCARESHLGLNPCPFETKKSRKLDIGRISTSKDVRLLSNNFSGELPQDVKPQAREAAPPSMPDPCSFTTNRTGCSLNHSSNLPTGKFASEFENAANGSSLLNHSGLCAKGSHLGLNACAFALLAVIFCAVGTIFILALLFAVFAICRRKHGSGSASTTWRITPFNNFNFTASNILANLTENNMIGSGGSGKVYRVAVNHPGKFVAVKKIWNNKKTSHKLQKQFLAEIQVLGTIRHNNIVKLLCFISSENSKLLVYEYLGNLSLDLWIHRKKRPLGVSISVPHGVLDWPKRLQIAVGAAHGLCYMHNDCSPPIIHRDMKSSNILLDSEFNAKIADFGLAKILIKQGEASSTSAVAGTVGYIAPEYAQTARVSEKIDVYSFGVVLLELATGREAKDGGEHTSLAEWACRYIQEGNRIVDALDDEIKEPYYLEEMVSVFKLGIFCTGNLPSSRPCMEEVLQCLQRCNRHPLAYGEKSKAMYGLRVERREEKMTFSPFPLFWHCV